MSEKGVISEHQFSTLHPKIHVMTGCFVFTTIFYTYGFAPR